MGQTQSYELSTSSKSGVVDGGRRRYKDGEQLLVSCENLKCPVCLDPFQIAPLLFPCGHSVCVDCTMLIRSNAEPKNYCCPTCRYAVATYTELRRNYLVGRILDNAECSNSRKGASKKQYDEEISKLYKDLDSMTRRNRDLNQRLTEAENSKKSLIKSINEKMTEIDRLHKVMEKRWNLSRMAKS